MDTERILGFLRDISANNNRPWFAQHKDEYLAAKEDFEAGIALAIPKIATLDPSVAHIKVKDAVYRFYRDTRFSPDKSPYKRHLGAYIAAHGKKALHGGYYIHLEPGACMLACGSYYLPTNILTACRNEIIANEQQWLQTVENPHFVRLFGTPGAHDLTEKQGFGIAALKTAPTGFPRDYRHMPYLRMKDYCCWKQVPDNFFDGDDWLDEMMTVFAVAKPMMDFVNAVIDDYE